MFFQFVVENRLGAWVEHGFLESTLSWLSDYIWHGLNRVGPLWEISVAR